MSEEKHAYLDDFADRGFGERNGEARSARIVLVDDDPVFAEDLAARLRRQGHEVRAFDDLKILIHASRASDTLEIAITRLPRASGGVRIWAFGIPGDRPYTGPLVKFLVEPVTVTEVMNALRLFLPVQGF